MAGQRASLPVATTISGMDSMEVLKQNLEVALAFSPLSENAMTELRSGCRGEQRRTYGTFKTTTMYDGKIGREQHGYPSVEEMPA